MKINVHFGGRWLFPIVLAGFALICMPGGNARAEKETGRRPSLFGQFGHDVMSLAEDPVFYIMTAGMLVTPPLLSHEDPEINETWAQSEAADQIFELGNSMGNAIFPVTASGLALVIGKIDGEPDLSDFGSELLRAQALNGILTVALKMTTNRRRPDGNSWSFPSGHTSSTFASATVIYRHYGPKYGVPAFAAAIYVGMSRLQENKHYLSDVIAGAILGGYIGLKVSGDHEAGQKNFNIFPTFGSVNGINMSIRF